MQGIQTIYTMSKTVFITGASSGIGRAAAEYFAQQGWNVAATMRNPSKETALNQLPKVRLYTLDVTDNATIDAALAAARQDFGRIDVVVNNAGYGVDGVFEAMSDDVIFRQFNTNVFGLMRVTRAVIPIMREQRGGTIVQISSMGGQLAFPLYSIYHGTKWAVEGFSESLHYELEPFGIKVRIVEPGPIKTDFYDRSREFIQPENTTVYNQFIQKVDKMSQASGAKAKGPEVVAPVIFRAATAKGSRLRYAVGPPGPLLLTLRKLLPVSWFIRMIKQTFQI